MNNNSWFKKEKPMVTLPGLGGGSASNLYWRPAGGGGGGLTYVDDVFSNYNYTGKGKIGTNHAAICNGLNLGQKNFGKSVEFKYRTTQSTDVGEALEIPYSSDFAVGTGDFTIETFVRIGPNPDGYCTIFSQGWPFQVYYNQGTNKFESYFSNSANSGSYFLNGFNSTSEIYAVLFIFALLGFLNNLLMYLKVIESPNDSQQNIKNSIRPLIVLVVITRYSRKIKLNTPTSLGQIFYKEK